MHTTYKRECVYVEHMQNLRWRIQFCTLKYVKDPIRKITP